MLPIYLLEYGFPSLPSLVFGGNFRLSKYPFVLSSQYIEFPSLTEYIARFLGICISGCVRMNSPSALSIVNPLTVPPFIVKTSCADAPYIVNPAASSSVPGMRRSSGLGLDPEAMTLSGSFMMPKIVPTLTPASRLLDPSIGSHATT